MLRWVRRANISGVTFSVVPVTSSAVVAGLHNSRWWFIPKAAYFILKSQLISQFHDGMMSFDCGASIWKQRTTESWYVPLEGDGAQTRFITTSMFGTSFPYNDQRGSKIHAMTGHSNCVRYCVFRREMCSCWHTSGEYLFGGLRINFQKPVAENDP